MKSSAPAYGPDALDAPSYLPGISLGELRAFAAKQKPAATQEAEAASVREVVARYIVAEYGATPDEARPFAERAAQRWLGREPVSPVAASALRQPLQRRGRHARRSHGAKTLRTRGSRRCRTSSTSSRSSDEPPGSSSHRRSTHSRVPTTQALVGGSYSLASAARASACSCWGHRP